MRTRSSIALPGIAALTLWLSACGNGSSANMPISVAFASVPVASLPAGTTAPVAAVVNNDNNNAGVRWTVTCTGRACGSFNPTASQSNSPTTYTAPSTIPTGKVVTITATSVSDSTKSVSAKITITTPPPAPLADGTYIFHLAGEDLNGGSPYYVAGAFTLTNGFISGGEQDFVNMTNGGTDQLIASGCALGTTSNGNIQIILATGNPNVGVNGVETLRGSRVSGSRALIAEFDASASASGSLDLQTSKSAPAGGYAFNLSGLDGAAQANALVMGGILDITGGSISLSNSVLDYNDGGSIGQKQRFSSGAVSAPDSFGRITLTLTPRLGSGAPEFGLTGYIVGADRIELVEEPSDALKGTLGGRALGQGSNTGKFTVDSVVGKTYVYTAVGADVNGLATFAGGFALNADGTVNGNIALNDLEVTGGPPIATGNWTIDPTGRVTISNVTPSLVSDTPFAFELYLDGNGNALELGVDKTQATAGNSYLQTTAAINAGNYALAGLGFSSISSNQPVWSAAGPISIDDAGNWTGFTDYTVAGSGLLANAALSASIDPSQGLFMITGLDATNTGADAWGYFPVDGSRSIAIEVDHNQLGTLLIESVTQ